MVAVLVQNLIRIIRPTVDMPDFIRSYSCNVSYVEIVDKVVAKIIIVEFTISLCSLLRFMIPSPLL